MQWKGSPKVIIWQNLLLHWTYGKHFIVLAQLNYVMWRPKSSKLHSWVMLEISTHSMFNWCMARIMMTKLSKPWQAVVRLTTTWHGLYLQALFCLHGTIVGAPPFTGRDRAWVNMQQGQNGILWNQATRPNPARPGTQDSYIIGALTRMSRAGYYGMVQV